MSWEYVALGELYEVHNGLSKGGKFFGKGSPFLSFSTVFNKWFLPQELLDLVQSTDNEQQSYSILRGDVFITRTSETMDELGMSSVALKDYPHATYNGFTKRLRPINPERVLPEFIGYYLRTPVFRAGFTAFSTMTTRASLRNEDLLSMKVPVPDMQTQKHIASILSAYDDLVENNQKQIKLLEEAAQRLYKEWFVDLRFPGHETTPIVDGIPEGWERMVLSEVTSVLKRGISPKYSDNGKYSVINQKCIRSSIMDISESRRQEKEYAPTLNLQDSDTVICSTGTGTLGRVGRVYGDYPNTTFDSHVTLVRAKENPNYIYHVVKSQQEYLMGMGRGSTNQQELYRDVIERLVVLCPSQDILLKAERVLNAIHCKIKAVYLQNNLLVESRDRLLPKLMSGEIEV
jgi:type I restriction enzyme S subunit